MGVVSYMKTRKPFLSLFFVYAFFPSILRILSYEGEREKE